MEKTLQTISNLFSKTMITNNGNKWDSKLEICLKKFLLEDNQIKFLMDNH